MCVNCVTACGLELVIVVSVVLALDSHVAHDSTTGVHNYVTENTCHTIHVMCDGAALW